MGLVRKIFLLFTIAWTAFFAGLWIRSHHVVESLYIGTHSGGNVHLILDRGMIKFIWTDAPVPKEVWVPRWISYKPSSAQEIKNLLERLAPAKRSLGLVWHGDRAASKVAPDNDELVMWWLNPSASIRWVGIWMGWPVIPGAATLAAGLLLALRRGQAKRNKTLCPHCGYDLRASPELCPECGKSPQERPSHLRGAARLAMAMVAAAAVGAVAISWPARREPLHGIVGMWNENESPVQMVDYFRADGDTFMGRISDDNNSVQMGEIGTWVTDGDLLLLKTHGQLDAHSINVWIAGDAIIYRNLENPADMAWTAIGRRIQNLPATMATTQLLHSSTNPASP